MSVSVSVRMTANDVILTFSGILNCEWHSRGHRFDPDRLHQSPKPLFIAVFGHFLCQKTLVLFFCIVIINGKNKPFFRKMSVKRSVKKANKKLLKSKNKKFF